MLRLAAGDAQNGIRCESPPADAAGAPRQAVDLGCGTGRDCVYLAGRGWQVLGVDYLEKQLVRAADLAQRAGVAASVWRRASLGSCATGR